MSSGSITMGTFPMPQVSHMVTEDETVMEEDEDGHGSGDVDVEGNASLAQQNRMLQADLADKNRYIATLEKRLLQARRTSHSRVSMHFATRVGLPEEGRLEGVLRERDREIEELRIKLDDQMRMVTALRSAARKREMVDKRKSHATTTSEETARPATSNGRADTVSDLSSVPFKRQTSSRASRHSSRPSTASRSSSGVVNFSKTPLSPMAILSPGHSASNSRDSTSKEGFSTVSNRRKSVDEMTQLLDQMIQDKVESGHVVRGERGSLRVRHDTVLAQINDASGTLHEDSPITPGQRIPSEELKAAW